MTREDIVNAMSLEDAIQVFRDTNCYGTMDIAKTVILRALEQEPILDKIRAELETSTDKWWYGLKSDDCFMKLSDVLSIIDKYRKE